MVIVNYNVAKWRGGKYGGKKIMNLCHDWPSVLDTV